MPVFRLEVQLIRLPCARIGARRHILNFSQFERGAVKMAEKIREEAEETIAEALRLKQLPGDPAIRRALMRESADLLFHLMVLLAYYNVAPDDVLGELDRRSGTSGQVEKAKRGA